MINKKIQTAILQSMKTLKTTLSTNELRAVSFKFKDIHQYKISTENAFFELQRNNEISSDKVLKIEKAFYDIGNHIAIPIQGESASNVINYVYNQIQELEKFSDTSDKVNETLNEDDDKEQNAVVSDKIQQLKNGEFGSTFDPEQYKKLSAIILQLGGKETYSLTDHLDTYILDYELGSDKVSIFILDPWDMTVSSHNLELIEEITKLMGDSGNIE